MSSIPLLSLVYIGKGIIYFQSGEDARSKGTMASTLSTKILFYLEEKEEDACPHKNRCGDVRPGSTALDYGPFV